MPGTFNDHADMAQRRLSGVGGAARVSLSIRFTAPCEELATRTRVTHSIDRLTGRRSISADVQRAASGSPHPLLSSAPGAARRTVDRGTERNAATPQDSEWRRRSDRPRRRECPGSLGELLHLGDTFPGTRRCHGEGPPARLGVSFGFVRDESAAEFLIFSDARGVAASAFRIGRGWGLAAKPRWRGRLARPAT